MHESFELEVHLACDSDSGRWYIAESDIPGLWLEAASPTELIERIQLAAPELIELNEAEILERCRLKAIQAQMPPPVRSRPVRPSIRPVFDSPFELAYG